MILDQPASHFLSVDTNYQQRHALPAAFNETSPGPMNEAGNPAALHWFGLLASDAGREVVPADRYLADPSRNLLDEGALTDLSPLQRATSIVDSSQSVAGSASDPVSSAEGIRLSAPESERQLWQSEEPIQLLPSERVIFDNFVQNLSLWVRLLLFTRGGMSIIVMNHPADADRLICLTQDVIFRHWFQDWRQVIPVWSEWIC